MNRMLLWTCAAACSVGLPTALRAQVAARTSGLAQEVRPLNPNAKDSTTARIAVSRALNLAGDTAKLEVNFKDSTLKDALKSIFDTAKREYVVDEDVKSEARISVKADSIRLTTVLDLVTQAAGVGWSHEQRDGKWVYRITKNPTTVALGHGMSFTPLNSVTGQAIFGQNLQTFSVSERVLFSCPHCKGKTTVVRPRENSSCPKCSRAFQPEWQFCPADGSKRPSSKNSWKFCPMCGKGVEGEKTETSLGGNWGEEFEYQIRIDAGDPVEMHRLRYHIPEGLGRLRTLKSPERYL